MLILLYKEVSMRFDNIFRDKKSSQTGVSLKYGDIFVREKITGHTSLVQYRINAGNSSPIRQFIRRLPLVK